MPNVRADPFGVAGDVEIFTRFLRLGITSFGGPVAHLGYFRREFVERAKWLDDAAFAEIVALCSVLPGPTSSQVGIVLGLRRAGWSGALLAWLGFTLPSALALAAFGIEMHRAALDGAVSRPLLGGIAQGLLAAAAAVVLLAVLQLARTLVTTPLAAAIAAAATAAGLGIDRYAPGFQWLPLALGGAVGGAFGPPAGLPRNAPLARGSRRTGAVAGGALVLLLCGLPIVAAPGTALGLFALFFRAGSLVFGGGHVVLPFLQSAIGPLVGERAFFAGYGAAQAVPGPLFTFAAFLGAANGSATTEAAGAAIALAGIFAPSFLLVAAVLPLWRALRDVPRAGAVLAGLNAAVVGLLAAVLVDPIATSLAREPKAAALAAVAFVALARTRVPAWAVVLACAAAGAALAGSGRTAP
ncbi:MAG: chromate efflux transporter [Vulcanimicrobiaceae bacterium]